jgi:hypothetical protein
MTKYLIATAVVAALATPASSGSQEPFALMGVGTSTCAQFGNLYREDQRFWEYAYFTWAQGYMSAMNKVRINSGESTKNLNAISVETQERQVRGYCNSHSLAQYMEAAAALYDSLPEIPGTGRNLREGEEYR